MCPRDLNSGPHIPKASVLTTEPSPRFPHIEGTSYCTERTGRTYVEARISANLTLPNSVTATAFVNSVFNICINRPCINLLDNHVSTMADEISKLIFFFCDFWSLS